MKPFRAKTPLLLLTGFLGSGKTTLLRELLTHREMRDTAVIINEIGAIGLDHHLVQGAAESVLVLENGCVCCSVRDDFIGVLTNLFWNRLHRKIPWFSRVVIETTGIADPLPVIDALLKDTFLADSFRIEGIVTTVDAVLGEHQLENHLEATSQIVAADTLLITKLDLVTRAAVAKLQEQLATLNPLALQRLVTHGQIAPDQLFPGNGVQMLSHRARQSASHVHRSEAGARGQGDVHKDRIQSFTIELSGPVERDTALSALALVLKQHDNRILRIKGLIRLIDEADPVVVQAVGNTLFPFQTAASPYDPDQGSFLVFITTELDERTVLVTLDRAFPGIFGDACSEIIAAEGPRRGLA